MATYESRFVMLFILIKHLISKTIWKAWKLIHAQIDFHKTLVDKYTEGNYYYRQGT